MSKFYRVSEKIFKEHGFTENTVELPRRATVGSAGYDFFAPMDIIIPPGGEINVPTLIRAQIDDNWVLFMMPRSSLGYKYKLKLDNTIGVIDSDYFHANNEGHISLKMTNTSENTVQIKKGESMCQGVFLIYGLTEDDYTVGKRTGGIGSTNKK